MNISEVPDTWEGLIIANLQGCWNGCTKQQICLAHGSCPKSEGSWGSWIRYPHGFPKIPWDYLSHGTTSFPLIFPLWPFLCWFSFPFHDLIDRVSQIGGIIAPKRLPWRLESNVEEMGYRGSWEKAAPLWNFPIICGPSGTPGGCPESYSNLDISAKCCIHRGTPNRSKEEDIHPTVLNVYSLSCIAMWVVTGTTTSENWTYTYPSQEKWVHISTKKRASKNVDSIFLLIAPNWMQPKCPFQQENGEYIAAYSHNGILRNNKKNKPLPYAKTWGISQTLCSEKDTKHKRIYTVLVHV